MKATCIAYPLSLKPTLLMFFSFLRYTKFQGEWDDFAAEEQAFKKFKKGKLSKDIYEEALLAESAPDGDQIDHAAKKGTPYLLPIRFWFSRIFVSFFWYYYAIVIIDSNQIDRGDSHCK